MSTAKGSGIKVPSKIARPPGTGAPKTNPSTGEHHNVEVSLPQVSLVHSRWKTNKSVITTVMIIFGMTDLFMVFMKPMTCQIPLENENIYLFL